VVEKRLLKNYWVPRKRTELEAVENVIIRIFVFILFTLCCFDGVMVEMSETYRKNAVGKKGFKIT
jgi:hypothetical protein